MQTPNASSSLSMGQLLEWYVEIGADEAVGDELWDRTKVPEKKELPRLSEPVVAAASAPAPALAASAPAGTFEALAEARAAAARASTLDELKEALQNFKGLTLQRTASHMVFGEGVEQARIVFVGEAPGADEDRLGRPFVGASGQLLDKMLAAIDLSRDSNAYITNIINWRPPGNRSPSDAEVALSLPFVQRHIELLKPEILVCLGGVPLKALFETSLGITRARGKWMEYQSAGLAAPVRAIATFHPSYLLRTPQHKALAWQDLLRIRQALAEGAVK